MGDSGGDGKPSANNENLKQTHEELEAARAALSESMVRQEATEKERDRLVEELARLEAKHQEYAAAVKHDKEILIAEVEAAKSIFHKKLEESVQEKFALQSRLVLAKQDAVDLAVQVEKLAEISFQQATAHILEDAWQRVSTAETSAAEAAYHIEEQIRNTTEGTILSIVEQSKDTIGKALSVAEKASEHAKRRALVLTDGTNLVDEIASSQAENLRLQNSISDLESQLLLTRNEVDRLKSDLEQVLKQAKSLELRASNAEKTLVDFQESTNNKSLQLEEQTKSFLDKMKKEAARREKAASKAFKAELEGVMAAVDAAKKTSNLKDDAYMRRCAALQRSLNASEAALKVWRQRAEIAESLIQKEPSLEGDGDEVYVANGGRIDLLTENDSLKWKLLADGPRRDIPEWKARKIMTIFPKFPPRKTDLSEAHATKFKSLELPNLEEIWSIAQEKPKEGDTLVEHVFEKEIIEKKRKTLERALQRRTTQLQKTPEQTKLEPGTGTGREIVVSIPPFGAFTIVLSRSSFLICNVWYQPVTSASLPASLERTKPSLAHSGRGQTDLYLTERPTLEDRWLLLGIQRKWYLELAPKAADLSQSGITSVWFPPPTESVAPQGYMPSDLYNLNSAYGSEEELKYCIDEMHNHGILALGDVVLNHRCAQKQVNAVSYDGPNGVWNIFGGKLAWGPEAIVCDDPNFQGQGNPSSGMQLSAFCCRL
ncbi:hypothetical protein ACLOJK_002449 [Asimina triloba]